MKLDSAGPVISALPENREISLIYDGFELWAVRPRIYPYTATEKLLVARSAMPDPAVLDEDILNRVELMHDLPVDIDPASGYRQFVLGAAASSLMLDSNDVQIVKMMLERAATHISEGNGLPELDAEFIDEIKAAELAIIRNGEPLSFFGLLAFAQGAFWVLSYVKNPRHRRKTVSPLTYVSRLVATRAQVGAIPA